MNKLINILYLEDVPADAARFDRELLKAGMVFHSQRVDTEAEFLRELEKSPDVILSDHGLPSFSGLTALGLARVQCPEVPFLFVTNALTREMEIEKLSGGVADYVLKSRLDYLPDAVRRALRMVKENRERRELLDELRRQLAFVTHFRQLFLPICSHCKRIRDDQNQWLAPELYFRDLLKFQYTHSLCPDCLPKFFPGIQPPRQSPPADPRPPAASG